MRQQITKNGIGRQVRFYPTVSALDEAIGLRKFRRGAALGALMVDDKIDGKASSDD